MLGVLVLLLWMRGAGRDRHRHRHRQSWGSVSPSLCVAALGPCRRHLSVESCLMRGVGRDAGVGVYWGLAIWETLVGDAVIDAHESHLRPSDACYA